jgi:hypothetical protein
MGRELLCTTGRSISDYCLVIVKVEWQENYCVTQVEELVIIVW